MIPILLLFSFFLKVSAEPISDTAHSTAVILCYATDKLTKNACDEIERRLKDCGTTSVRVLRLNNPSQETLPATLHKELLPAKSLFLIVGHGMADPDQNHFIATQNFWDEHPEQIKPEKIPQLVDENKLIAGKTLNTQITQATKAPTVWYLSCHSGGNCTHGGNIGASCSSWETTAITQFKPIVKISLKIDASTRKILSLLCTPGEFSQFDKNKDNLIQGKEWLAVFDSEHEKTTTIEKSSTTTAGREAIKKQLEQNSAYCETDKELFLTQTRCVNSAGPFNTPCLASPVISQFSLPNWDQQREPAPQLQTHKPLSPSTH